MTGMREQKFLGNVFVANLPKGYTHEELANLFDPFGIVVGAFLARDPATGASKRHGLVNIAPERAASEAVAALNGMDIGGRPILARPPAAEKGAAVTQRLPQPRCRAAPAPAPPTAAVAAQ